MSNAELSLRIRKLRERRRLTLQQVADACGVTPSMLSKVENGRAMPSVATLTQLATALGVSLSALLQQDAGDGAVLSRAIDPTGDAWNVSDKGYRFAPLCSERVEKLMQPMLFVAEKGKVKPGALRHSGEEFVHVLEGRMKYTVGKTTHELGPGDSLYFDAEEPHDLEPITKTVRYLAVFLDRATPPAPRKNRGK